MSKQRLGARTLLRVMGCVALLQAGDVSAIDFGVFDVRSLAMGGAAVASGEGQNAHFSNPALLSLYDGQEEDTRNGRAFFPSVVARASTGIVDTLNVVDLDLDDQVDDAVNAFNNDGSTANAFAVADSTQSLLNELTGLGSQNLDGDAFIGFSLSEPSNRQGGSFFIGIRAVGNGSSVITQNDLDLLQSFVDTATALANGEIVDPNTSNILNADGDFVSPSDVVTSSATVSSLVSTEVGIALSKEFKVGNTYVSLGVTPKFARVEVFTDIIVFADTDIDFEDDSSEEFTANFDLGAVWEVGENYRVALAIRDFLPQSFEAGNGLTVETTSRSRAGFAYLNRSVTLGLDLDLQRNETLNGVLANQDLAFGIEYRPLRWLDLRGGYRNDIQSTREDIFSFGIGFHPGRFVADLAFAQSSEEVNVGLQIGFAF